MKLSGVIAHADDNSDIYRVDEVIARTFNMVKPIKQLADSNWLTIQALRQYQQGSFHTRCHRCLDPDILSSCGATGRCIHHLPEVLPPDFSRTETTRQRQPQPDLRTFSGIAWWSVDHSCVSPTKAVHNRERVAHGCKLTGIFPLN